MREANAKPSMASSSSAFTMAEHDGDDGDDESTMDSALPAPPLPSPPPLPAMLKTEETDEFSGGKRPLRMRVDLRLLQATFV